MELTGVKSAGCEKRMAQVSPIHSWKLMRPLVVSALKSGATEPSLREGEDMFGCGLGGDDSKGDGKGWSCCR